MPEYLYPGVYVTEIDANVTPIEGVSTSTADVIGADCLARLQRLAGPLPPEWTDHDDNDPGVALLELLAFLADRLGARLDLVSDEAMLHTSRLAAAALTLLKDRTLPRGSVLKSVAFHERQTSPEDGLAHEESGCHRLRRGHDEAG